jgi:type VI secretion system protein ImpA
MNALLVVFPCLKLIFYACLSPLTVLHILGYPRMSEIESNRLDLLLTPIPGGAVAGPDLRSDVGAHSLYVQLKDARTAARAAERAVEAAGDPVAVPSEWRTVVDLAQACLGQRSKDLEIAAWMVEALVRLEGFAGLDLGFKLVQGLAERYWPVLHSVDGDDISGKVSPLAGLNGVGGEGTLIQPIRMVPLVPGSPFGSLCLWNHQVARRDKSGKAASDFAHDLTAAGRQALREGRRSAKAALDSFISLTARLENLCGADAPPSSHTSNVLGEVANVYRELLGDAEDSQPQVAEAGDAGAADVASAAAPGQGDVREVRTREQAFAELLRIAAFFRKAEPHSPISYALETLVARGKKDLIELLDELLPDAGSRNQFLQLSGIGTPKGAIRGGK